MTIRGTERCPGTDRYCEIAVRRRGGCDVTESCSTGRGEPTRPLPPYRTVGPQDGCAPPVDSPVPSLSTHAPDEPAASRSVRARAAAPAPAPPPVAARPPTRTAPRRPPPAPAVRQPAARAAAGGPPAPAPVAAPAPAAPRRRPPPARRSRARPCRAVGLGQEAQDGDLAARRAAASRWSTPARPTSTSPSGAPPMIRSTARCSPLDGLRRSSTPDASAPHALLDPHAAAARDVRGRTSSSTSPTPCAARRGSASTSTSSASRSARRSA